MRKNVCLAGLLVLVLGLVFSAGSLYADGKGHGKGHGKEGLDEKFMKKAHMIMMYQDELGLSDETVDGIKALKIETKKNLITKKAQIEVLAIDIKAGLYAEKIDVEAIDKLIDQKYELKKEKAKMLVAAYAKLKGMLTEEQMDTMKGIWMTQKKAALCKGK